MRTCAGCDRELGDDVEKCPDCKKSPVGQLCDVCGRRMPKDARICNTCKSYWKRSHRRLARAGTIVTAIGAIITALGAFVVVAVNVWTLASALDRHSHTHMKFLATKTDAAAIRAMVWNSGREASWILRSRLEFENPQVAPVALDLRCCPTTTGESCDTTNLIEAGHSVMACLKADAITFRKPGKDGPAYVKNDALVLIRDHKVTLVVHVEESNDSGTFGKHPYHTLTATFDELQIRSFLEAP